MDMYFWRDLACAPETRSADDDPHDLHMRLSKRSRGEGGWATAAYHLKTPRSACGTRAPSASDWVKRMVIWASTYSCTAVRLSVTSPSRLLRLKQGSKLADSDVSVRNSGVVDTWLAANSSCHRRSGCVVNGAGTRR
eukprot:3929003-Rhodomonas_salina.1